MGDALISFQFEPSTPFWSEDYFLCQTDLSKFSKNNGLYTCMVSALPIIVKTTFYIEVPGITLV